MAEFLDTKGYVYLMTCPLGVYKIGQSVDPEKRRKRLEKSRGRPVSLVCAIPVDDMTRVEAWFHKRYDDRRVVWSAEWFVLTETQVAEFLAIADAHEGLFYAK